MTWRIISFGPLLTAPLLFAQYQAPESVEYDEAADRYLVSNLQSASIRARAQDGTVSLFAGPLPNAPYGLEILDGVVYACMGSGLRGYDLASGQEVFDLSLGAQFPNGITTDGSMLYVTDFHTNSRRIYKVDPQAGTFSLLVSNTGWQPNGIVWDPVGERLVVVFWGTNTPVRSYDRVTGMESVLLSDTGLGNCDGITIDCDGNFLISSWLPAAITRFEPTFTQPGVDLNVPGVTNPADIDFDPVNERVCIPNTANSTVVLHAVNCVTSVSQTPSTETLRVIPQPVVDRFIVEGLREAEPYVLAGLDGRILQEGMLHPGMPVFLPASLPKVMMLRLPGSGMVSRLMRD